MAKRIKSGEKIFKIEKVNKDKKKKTKTKKKYIDNHVGAIVTIIIIAIAIGATVFFYTRSQKDFEGYWCNYEELSQIQVLLKDGYTSKQKKAIEDKINKFDDLESATFFSKDEYAASIGADSSNMDLYDAIIVTLSSVDTIGTYRDELKKMAGVHDATQMRAKSNVKLYNIEPKRKYTFKDSDEALEEDIIRGTYKEKKGVLTFTPEDKSKQQTMLYYKNGLLCEDSACTVIFFKSTDSCAPYDSEKEE